jgi:hypothetical protein
MTDYERGLAKQLEEFNRNWQENNGTTPVTPPAAPQPLEVTIGGQKMTFNSPAELETALNATLEREAGARVALEQALKSTAAPATPPPADDKNAWKLKFFETLENDPEGAFDMVLNKRLQDPNAQGWAAITRHAAGAAEQTRQLVEIAAFKDANPDFDPVVHSKVLDGIRTQLGLPLTSQGLDAAWKTGVGHGIFKIPQQQQQNEQEPPNPYAPPPAFSQRFAPPPAPSADQNTFQHYGPDINNQLDSMPMEKLAAFMRANGMDV